jgi:phosphatidylglycerol:prolipoprotein diacylglycerol transferase
VCQTLVYIPPVLYGIPVFGFGLALFLFVAAVVFCIVWHYRKTKKWDEETGSYLGMLAVGAAVLIFVAPNIIEPDKGFPIRGYGVCLVTAIFASLGLVLYLAKKKGITSELIFSLCLWAVISGIFGARLFYFAEYWRDMTAFDAAGNLLLLETLYNFANVANGGLVVFGSIIGGILGSAVFMIRNKMPVWRTFDAMAPAMMLGIAFGRIGCLLNGCCFGGVTELPWGINFPAGSPAHIHQIDHGDVFYCGLKLRPTLTKSGKYLAVAEVEPGSVADQAGLKPEMILRGIAGVVEGQSLTWEVSSPIAVFELVTELQKKSPGENIRFDVFSNESQTETKPYFLTPSLPHVLPVQPTQIYSSFLATLLCGILLLLGRQTFFRQRDGLVFASFMILYAVTRFGIETIRTDEGSFLGTGLTVSQNVSIVVFAAGILLAIYLVTKSKTSKPQS